MTANPAQEASTRDPQLRGGRAAAIVALVLLFGCWIWHLDTPFSRVRGFADWIGNRNGLIVDNYLRYGLTGSRGAQIMNLEPVPDAASRVIYRGHPPTLDLLTAGLAAGLGNTPLVQRLLPLLGSLLAFLILHRALRRTGADPWPALFLFAAFPVMGVHGVNFSYEPLCLPAMLLAAHWFAIGESRDRHVLAALFLGGLFDWPALYMAPLFASIAWLRGRRRFALWIGVVAGASFAATVGHQILTMGGLAGLHGKPWHEKIAQAFAPPNLPPIGDWLWQQIEFFDESFTIPGVALALLGLAWFRARLGFVSGAFGFCALLHVAAFRGHAHVHDFWLWYALPVFAIAGGRVLSRLPQPAAWVAMVAVGVLGAVRTGSVWRERAAPPVRAVASDLKQLFEDDVVVHQLRMPPGWSTEVFRGAPVVEGEDMLLQALGGSFRVYLDTLAGTWGYLHRPQRAVLFLPGAAPEHRPLVEKWFPGSELAERDGRAGRYVVYDIGPFLVDPKRSPEMLRLLGEAECTRLWYRARLHLVVPLFPPGTKLLWLDGTASAPERLRGRIVRGGGADQLSGDTVSQGWTAAAWPETEAARGLASRAGDRLEFVPLTWRGRHWRVPCLRP